MYITTSTALEPGELYRTTVDSEHYNPPLIAVMTGDIIQLTKEMNILYLGFDKNFLNSIDLHKFLWKDKICISLEAGIVLLKLQKVSQTSDS